jgi:hypothetical protein
MPLENEHIGIRQQDVLIFNGNIAIPDYHVHVKNIDFVKKTDVFCGHQTEYCDCRMQISDWRKEILRRRTQFRVENGKKLRSITGMLRSVNGILCLMKPMLSYDSRLSKLEIGKCGFRGGCRVADPDILQSTMQLLINNFEDFAQQCKMLTFRKLMKEDFAAISDVDVLAVLNDLIKAVKHFWKTVRLFILLKSYIICG